MKRKAKVILTVAIIAGILFFFLAPVIPIEIEGGILPANVTAPSLPLTQYESPTFYLFQVGIVWLPNCYPPVFTVHEAFFGCWVTGVSNST